VFDIAANGGPTAPTFLHRRDPWEMEIGFHIKSYIWYSKGIRNYFLSALHILNIIILYFLSLLPGSVKLVPFMIGVLKKKKKKDFRIFIGLFFTNNIYMKQI